MQSDFYENDLVSEETTDSSPIARFDEQETLNDTRQEINPQFLNNVLERDGDRDQSEIEIRTTESGQLVRCRVCFLDATETGETLSPLGCECKGSLEFAHKSCIREWIQIKHSNICEVCQGSFNAEYIPPEQQIRHEDTQTDEFYSAINVDTSESREGEEGLTPEDGRMLRRLSVLASQSDISSKSPCGRNKRVWFAFVVAMLLFATISASSLTASVHNELLHEELLVTNTTYLEDTDFTGGSLWHTGTTTRNMFRISMCLLLYCLFMVLCISLLWAYAELVVWPLENYLLAHYDIARPRRRRRRTVDSNRSLDAVPRHSPYAIFERSVETRV